VLGYRVITVYALYEPTHGKTRRGRPRTNYITYVQKITGHQLSELIELTQNREDWRRLVVECADPQPPDYNIKKSWKVGVRYLSPKSRGTGTSRTPVNYGYGEQQNDNVAGRRLNSRLIVNQSETMWVFIMHRKAFSDIMTWSLQTSSCSSDDHLNERPLSADCVSLVIFLLFPEINACDVMNTWF